MIIGYLPVKEDGIIYDYSACTFPEGILDTNRMLMFNHDKIEKINYIGLEDDEYNDYNNMIKEEYGFRKKENIDAKDDSLVETLNVD